MDEVILKAQAVSRPLGYSLSFGAEEDQMIWVTVTVSFETYFRPYYITHDTAAAGHRTSMLYPALLCSIILCHAFTYHAMPCDTMSCHTMSYHVIPCHVIPCHTIPCHTMPCHTMPFLVMPVTTLPCTTNLLHTPLHYATLHWISLTTVHCFGELKGGIFDLSICHIDIS